MQDLVIVKSKTINNESIPVVIKEIEQRVGTPGEPDSFIDVRKITRSYVFLNFQAEIPLAYAKKLVKSKPQEFTIVNSVSEETSEEVKKIVEKSLEKESGFKCFFCEATANSKAGLVSHIRYSHKEIWQEMKNKKVKVDDMLEGKVKAEEFNINTPEE
jgi:hypothetical protein